MLKAIITNIGDVEICFIKKDDKLKEIHPMNVTDIGNIYVGRIINYIKNINSAFVDLGNSKVGYLFSPKAKNLVDGEEIKNSLMYVCQISKDKRDKKNVECTSSIEIGGEYVVVSYDISSIRISKKIKELSKIEKLKALGNKYKRKNTSIIFRTKSADVDINEVEKELKSNISCLDEIFNKAKNRLTPCLLKKSKDYVYERLEKVDEIVTDVEEIYNSLKVYFGNVRFYEDEYSILAVNSLYKEIERLKNRVVNLNSGASIVIEHTEACTVIDVNSSKAVSSSKDKYSYYDINKMAAVEIVRQLKIRNIAGMIIIDFINMRSNEERESIIECMKKELYDDYTSSVIYGFTNLGLLEMTRRRVKDRTIEYMNESKYGIRKTK